MSHAEHLLNRSPWPERIRMERVGWLQMLSHKRRSSVLQLRFLLFTRLD